MKTYLALSVLIGELALVGHVHATNDIAFQEIDAVYNNTIVCMNSQNYEGLAHAYHPEALKGFRSTLNQTLALACDKKTSPIANATMCDSMYQMFLGVTGPSVADTLSDEAYFTRFFGSIMHQVSKISGPMTTHAKILGHVVESDTLVHLIARVGVALGKVDTSFTLSKVEATTFKLDDGSWKAILQGETSAKFAALVQNILRSQVQR